MPSPLLKSQPSTNWLEQIDAARRAICALLREQVGHDFSRYRHKTFLRRVHRRMQVLNITEIGDYVAGGWNKTTTEAGRPPLPRPANPVTSFFRDSETFEALEELVMPQLFEGERAGRTVRVWVPGLRDRRERLIRLRSCCASRWTR